MVGLSVINLDYLSFIALVYQWKRHNRRIIYCESREDSHLTRQPEGKSRHKSIVLSSF